MVVVRSIKAHIAQLVERIVHIDEVSGSSPDVCTSVVSRFERSEVSARGGQASPLAATAFYFLLT